MNARLTARDSLILAGLCGLLFSVYLFTFSGRTISDDELYLIDTAESLARRGSVLLTETGGLKWPGETQVEPLQPLLSAPLFWLADKLPFVGNVHTIMLFNPVVTTATAALVYLFVAALGYRKRVAAACSLTFGLATIAWPYSKNFFREPLTGLMLFATAYLLMRWRQAALGNEARSAGWLAAAAVVGGLGALTKDIALLVLPVFAAVFVPWGELRRWRRSQFLQIAGAVVGFVVLVSASIWFYQAVLLAGLNRFIRPLGFWGLDQGPQEALLALFGQLFSPGKSLFLYSPVLALSFAPLVGRPAAGRRRLDLAWPLALLALFVVAYAVARGELWWGGTGWGPRYLVPLTPFLVVALAPAWDYALTAGASWLARAGLGLVLGLSLLVQVAAVGVFPLDYYDELQRLGAGEAAPWTVGLWDPFYSAILVHWRLISTGLPDFAWARARAAGLDWLAAVPLALAMAGFAALLLWAWRPAGRAATRQTARLAAAGTLVAAVALTALLLWRIYPDRRYRGDNAALQAMRQAWQAEPWPGKALFLNNMTYFDFMLNYSKDDAPFYSMPLSPRDSLPAGAPRPAPSTDPDTLVFKKARSIVQWFPPHNYQTAGLLMETGPYHSGNLRSIEWWMAEAYYHIGTQEFAPDVRLLTYSTARAPRPGDPPAHPVGDRLGDAIVLAGYDLQPEQAAYRPGEVVSISVQWQVIAPPPADYTVGIDLIGPGPTLITQHDSGPVAGFWPTSAWQPGLPVRDNVAFVLPAGLPPGRYEVWALMYDSAVQRLPVAGPSGEALGDHLVLLSFQVK